MVGLPVFDEKFPALTSVSVRNLILSALCIISISHLFVLYLLCPKLSVLVCFLVFPLAYAFSSLDVLSTICSIISSTCPAPMLLRTFTSTGPSLDDLNSDLSYTVCTYTLLLWSCKIGLQPASLGSVSSPLYTMCLCRTTNIFSCGPYFQKAFPCQSVLSMGRKHRPIPLLAKVHPPAFLHFTLLTVHFSLIPSFLALASQLQCVDIPGDPSPINRLSSPSPPSQHDGDIISLLLTVEDTVETTTDLTTYWADPEIEEVYILTHSADVFTAYKRVDKKVRPVPGPIPQEAHVDRRFPEDPLLSLKPLPRHPPMFLPTQRISQDNMAKLKINEDGFLWPEEEKLFKHIMVMNEQSLAFEDEQRGTLRDDYFTPYIIPTIPHQPWTHKNIPIPPGIRDKVIDLLKEKIRAGVYEPAQSSYQSQWFCVVKKNGKLRLVHDLQPLNAVSLKEAGMPPILDDFVEPFAGRQCSTAFDLFWGFDARQIHPDSRDLTAFQSSSGQLRLTSLPIEYTNSLAEFQNCMTFILQDEIPHTANIFIDDLAIRGPASQYLDQYGQPSTLLGNPGIRQFIWEHANDVHRIMHRVEHAGATFNPAKAQICSPSVLILGQTCIAQGHIPDSNKVEKILNWPTLKDVKQVRGFLGLCGTVRIWIENYSKLARPLTELVRKEADFEWTPERQKAFDTLKHIVASAPALRPIDYTSMQPIILSVDSSKIAVGFILSQLDEDGLRRPARYGSLPMNEVESRYSQPKLELYGLYRALRHFALYIIGALNLFVEVDALYIKGMLNAPDLQPSASVNRWIQGILMFDFILVHVAGIKFVGPDALLCWELQEGEYVPDDEEWLDNIALYAVLKSYFYHL